jgi:hypothetical protein
VAQRLHLGLIAHLRQQVVVQARVGVDDGHLGDRVLELAGQRVGLGERAAARAVLGEIEGRRVVAVDGKGIGRGWSCWG